MKKSSAIALAGALALTLGTQAVAAPAAKQDAPTVNKTMKAKTKATTALPTPPSCCKRQTKFWNT